MSAAPVLLDVDGGVATITLNRPDARNRLDGPSMDLMRVLLADAVADERVRVIVITGAGDTFCAGADLAAVAAGDAGGFAGAAAQQLADLLTSILEAPKPVIARVQGHVAGGGNGIVAACDLAIASETAKLAFAEVRVGVAPAVISVVCLRVMQPRAAQALMLTGARVSALEAQAAGLLTEVVPPAALDAAVAARTAEIALGGPQALARTKELLARVPGMDRDEAFAWTAELSAALFASAEGQEGATAFVAKRPPSWTETS